jgi:hypothetical protein
MLLFQSIEKERRKMSKNCLKTEEMILVIDWLRKNANVHAQLRPNWNTLAEMAQRDLKLTVNGTNVKNLHKKLNLKWYPKRIVKNSKIRDLDRAICELLMTEVCPRLNIPVNEIPPIIREIFNEENQNETS